jgi:ribosomal protein L16/L10AE
MSALAYARHWSHIKDRYFTGARRMSDMSQTPQQLFFNQAGLDLDQTHRFTEQALAAAEDGKLFLSTTIG